MEHMNTMFLQAPLRCMRTTVKLIGGYTQHT